ncbi:response regulator [Desulfuribacillus alkaliarsenatis]|uniref:Response regulatory domain-containing protein n=1 Tax=Desulfuribacillus alkaliarsenatis TaxID=766136 RepID=A0A1E5G3M3_9FIRM|nr:response regulator [Desulfuribacillus alkaliarsenatis]OEF97687.1 hypothetical protein BHF68_14395 [Desulfuribacillus alkaliarsenatis]
MGELAVLIVEDSRYAADVNARQVQKAGYIVKYEIVSNKVEMIRLIQEQSWDLILSDHSLPAFSSLEALEIRNRYCPEVPFIIVTEYIGEKEHIVAIEGGCQEIIHKRELQSLRRAVQNLV